jgi:tight adherence protein C
MSMLAIGVIAIGAFIALALWAILSQADEKATVRASLRQLEGYEVDNMRDQELLAPVKDRAILPIVNGLTDLGRRFTPVGYIENTKNKLVAAGKSDVTDIDRFLAIRVATVVAVPIVSVLLLALLGTSGMLPIMAVLLLDVGLILGPDAILNRKVEARRHEIRIKLPEVLDLLVISVEAGLGFEQALDRTVSAVPGALTDEFSRMLGEVRAGASRSDSMRAMEKRCDVPELRSFVLAILQADTFGVSIGRVLRAQADEMRIKRRQLAQAQAQKAPVKMLIPMVFCVFPALFVIVLGPAVINIMDTMK